MKSTNKLLLGIDVGTTGTKSVVIDSCGRILANAYQGYETTNARIGYAEQDANDWWNAVVKTVRECTENEKIKNSIAAIGLSTQGGSMVPVDKYGEPLRPAIIWADKRGSSQSEYFRKNTPDDYFYLTTGWSLSNGLNAVQIRWMKENEPDLFDNTYKFLSTADYITMKLTGKYVIDPSNAGIMQLINLNNLKWDKKILDLTGISEEKLSKIVDSGEVIGELSCKASEDLGLPKETKVVSGGHDQYCVALGAGAINSGDVLISTGTAWVVVGIFDKPTFDTKTCIAQSVHTVKGKWGSLCSLGTGGVSLEWYRKNLCKPVPGAENASLESYKQIDSFVAQRSITEGDILFYPYFSGSSFPNRAPFNKGTVLGLDLSHDRYDVAKAIMEGVAFQTVWMLEGMQLHKNLSRIKMIGGATKSRVWTQMVADIAGVPVVIPKIPDIACIGAAILAGYGAGIFQSFEEGCRNLAAKEEMILPDHKNLSIYRKMYNRYKDCSNYITQSYSI